MAHPIHYRMHALSAHAGLPPPPKLSAHAFGGHVPPRHDPDEDDLLLDADADPYAADLNDFATVPDAGRQARARFGHGVPAALTAAASHVVPQGITPIDRLLLNQQNVVRGRRHAPGPAALPVLSQAGSQATAACPGAGGGRPHRATVGHAHLQQPQEYAGRPARRTAKAMR